MRSSVFFLSLFFVLILPFESREARAQIVSLLVDADGEHESLMMERAMKRYLEEDGYDVKKITFGEGFFIYVQLMPITTAQKHLRLGYAGNVIIGSQAWTKVVDSFMPTTCDMAFSQKMKENVGVEMVLLDSQIFTDASIESIAESISANVNKIIEEKSTEMTALMEKLAKKKIIEESWIIGRLSAL